MSDFDQTLSDMIAHLQAEQRVSYRALRRRFKLSDEELEDIKSELIDAKRLAVDEDGKVLVWSGRDQLPTPLLQPVAYTPPHLAERIRAQQTVLEARGRHDGERKTITILFADLKSSTALLAGLDPEEARAIIDPALQTMMDAVHRYEGYVAQALGDGILALFGAPLAQEDHAQRAVFAALSLQDEMRQYSDRIRLHKGVPLALRIGINTGEVVVRSIRKDDLQTDYVPVGHSINLAARMEQMATPGSILITEHTQKLVDGYVSLKALGPAVIKGLEASLPVFEVVGAGASRTRLQLAVRRGLARFVGRHQEISQMQRALDEACAGHGQVIGVMGEPGMGKSRLFHEFKATAQTQCAVFEAYSSAHSKAAPYLPLIELLKNYFQIQAHDDERTRREKIIGKLLTLDRTLEEVLPYFFALLNVNDPDSAIQPVEPQARRKRTFEALKRVTLRESLNRPLLLIFEDLHWIDSETQGVLDSLVEAIGSARILLIANYRPEYRHDWSAKSYYSQVRLAPLGRSEAEEFLSVLLGDLDSDQPPQRWFALRQLILEKTEGTPFFIEEVVQELFEQGTLARAAGRTTLATTVDTQLTIPTTVQGVLAARIDRLTADEKALLQQLAVIGREFPYGLARAVVNFNEDALHRLLALLQRKEFLYEQPAFPEVEYIFKHALTQDVAYQSLLVQNRQHLHERAAQAIETLYPLELEDHYGELAHHYSRSGNLEKALEYLEKAGIQATRQAANGDAVKYFGTALEYLNQSSATVNKSRNELRLLIALVGSLRMVKGMAAPDVERISLRVRELSKEVGEPAELFHALSDLRNSSTFRGDCRAALQYAQEMLALAERDRNEEFELYAHCEMGAGLVYLGEFNEALTHVAHVRELYDPYRHGSTILTYGIDPYVIGIGVIEAQSLWMLGYPSRAVSSTEDSLARARQISHPFMLICSMLWGGFVRMYRSEVKECLALVNPAFELARECGFPDWIATATILQGWASAHNDPQAGVEHIEQGISAYTATHAELALPLFHAIASEAYVRAKNLPRARLVLDEGINVAARNNEGLYQAELYRLRGEISLREAGEATAQAAAAETDFMHAIAIAQRQSAKSWELRATLSLTRLWLEQGKVIDAQARLSTIYNWFTEGFDTPDLIDARTLLDRLAETASDSRTSTLIASRFCTRRGSN